MVETYAGEEVNTETITNIFFVGMGIFAFGFVCFFTFNKNEAYLAATECVGEHWEEYETRTGDMPPVYLEQMWYRECIDGLKNK